MSVYTGIFNATVNPPQLNMKTLASHILRRQPMVALRCMA